MARTFDGLDDRLTVSSATGLPTSTGDITVAVWYYLPSAVDFRTLLSLGGSDGSCVLLTIGASHFGGFVSGSGSANFESTSQPPVTGAWRFVALRVSSGTCQIVNHGVNATTTGTVTGRTAPTGRFTVGSRLNLDGTGGAQFFAGRLSHVAIWESAVATADLLDMATNLKSPLHYPTNLFYYNQITGDANPEPPEVGEVSLDVFGTTQIDGPALTGDPQTIGYISFPPIMHGGPQLFAGTVSGGLAVPLVGYPFVPPRIASRMLFPGSVTNDNQMLVMSGAVTSVIPPAMLTPGHVTSLTPTFSTKRPRVYIAGVDRTRQTQTGAG